MNIGGNNTVPVVDITNTPSAAALHWYVDWLRRFYKADYAQIDRASSPEAAQKALSESMQKHLDQQRALMGSAGTELKTAAQKQAWWNYGQIVEAQRQVEKLDMLATNYSANMKLASDLGITFPQLQLLDRVAMEVNGEMGGYAEHIAKKSPDEKREYVHNVLLSIASNGKTAAIDWPPKQLAILQAGDYAEKARELFRQQDAAAASSPKKSPFGAEVASEASQKAPAVPPQETPAAASLMPRKLQARLSKVDRGIYAVASKDNFGFDGGPAALEQFKKMAAKIDPNYKADQDSTGALALHAAQQYLADPKHDYYAKAGLAALAEGKSDVDDNMGKRTRAAVRQFLADNAGYKGEVSGRAFGQEDFKDIGAAIAAVKIPASDNGSPAGSANAISSTVPASGENLATNAAHVMDPALLVPTNPDNHVRGTADFHGTIGILETWKNKEGAVVTTVDVQMGEHKIRDVSIANPDGTVTTTHVVDGKVMWAAMKDKAGNVTSLKTDAIDPDLKLLAEGTAPATKAETASAAGVKTSSPAADDPKTARAADVKSPAAPASDTLAHGDVMGGYVGFGSDRRKLMEFHGSTPGAAPRLSDAPVQSSVPIFGKEQPNSQKTLAAAKPPKTSINPRFFG